MARTHVGSVAAVAMMVMMVSACNVVGINRIGQKDYVNARRSDIISADRLSAATAQALNVVALTPKQCAKDVAGCTGTLQATHGLTEEQRLSALAEVWLASASRHIDPSGGMPDPTLDALLQSARASYGYLFFTHRSPGQRAFEQRQAQVIDFYNVAVQRIIERLFDVLPIRSDDWVSEQVAGWRVDRPESPVTLGMADHVPDELRASADLRFSGLRNSYARDGFGAEFVAISANKHSADPAPWRLPAYIAVTGALVFPGQTLDEVMASKEVKPVAADPYKDDDILIAGKRYPLAANFTAPYGLWLAESGFASESIRSLLGREGGIKTPRILLMQPYDPGRRVIVMLHGLASSPEAWINVSNEIMGDEDLRKTYQIWEVYYPTNVPIAVNLAQIRSALDETFRHFDPSGNAPASKDVVLIGHSMGGVIARLLVSTSDQAVLDVFPIRSDISPLKRAEVTARLAKYLRFTPMPQVERAIFLASPHRGTPIAQHTLARWFRNLIRLPVDFLKEAASIAPALKSAQKAGASARIANSVDNLSDENPFIRATADLPIAPRVRYNTIVGVYKNKGPLASSDDGVVPYASAHLDGAESELAVPSWHSVQETPQAILELRRILRADAAAHAPGHVDMHP